MDKQLKDYLEQKVKELYDVSLEIRSEVPKRKEQGDLSCNVAMQLAKVAKKAPRQVAQEILQDLPLEQFNIEKVEIAGPGFINLFLKKSVITKLISDIINADKEYGKSELGNSEKVNVEFVSANPTGDLHLGHARGAAIGDSICRIMSYAGYDVTREYYINDGGNQIINLAKSVEERYKEALGLPFEMPEDGYHGADVKEFGKQLAAEAGDKYLNEPQAFFINRGVAYELDKLKVDLESFNVKFDVFTSENQIRKDYDINSIIEQFKQKGYAYDSDGATWLKSTEFGDEKDRVLVKSDGSYTYLVPDIAYHKDKFDRGFNKCIDLLGGDHHGYIKRLKASIASLEYNPENLEIVILQMVRIVRDGQEVKMSKRTGNAYLLRDLIEDTGVDAARYFFAMRNCDTHMDFDLGLATSKSNENPVYYSQYAHARTSSILRLAKEKGFEPVILEAYDEIAEDKELKLIKKLGEFKKAVESGALKRDPQKITNYIYALASDFHSFYSVVKVVDEENSNATKQRLALVKATQITLRNALDLVGVSAPESM